MAPVSTEDVPVSSAGALCSGLCTLQVVLGCVIPLLLVASSIPIMMLIRHREKTKDSPKTRSQVITPRATTTPRLPMPSVYIARVDYYLPASDTMTAASQSAAGSRFGESCYSLGTDRSELNIPNVPSLPNLDVIRPTLASLPSLSSLLGEFSAYADAIDSEPEFMADARRSSTCLLDSVFSSMDVKALSFSTLPITISEPKVQDLALLMTLASSVAISRSTKDAAIIASKKASCNVSDPEDSFRVNYGSIFTKRQHASNDEEVVYPFDDMDVEALIDDGEIEIEEITTAQLASAATTSSYLFDSFATLASVLAIHLADFPPVPAFITANVSTIRGVPVNTRHSESSLESAITRSFSAPASLNILDIWFEDILRPKNPTRSYLIEWPSFSNPGELWDEEDDALFSAESLKKNTDISRPIRHTWTAGFTYSHSNQGDLWDDEDDRRISGVTDIDAVRVFAAASILSMNTAHSYVFGFSSQSTSAATSLGVLTEEVEDVGKDDRGSSSKHDWEFEDSGFAENTSCNLGLDFGSAKDPVTESIPYCEVFAPAFWSSSPSSLRLLAFDELGTSSPSPSLCSSASFRSSVMSFSSVLHDCIRIGDTPHQFENPEKIIEGCIDMELEPDFSYSSYLISVAYPIAD